VPPVKRGVRPPTLGEALRARQEEARRRVLALRARLLEPLLGRFPRLFPTRPGSAASYAAVSAVVWLLVGTLMAVTLAAKLVVPDFLGTFPWLGVGRLAGAAWAAVVLGGLLTGFVAAAFTTVPRASGRPLWSERLGAQTVILLDQVVLAGVVLVLLGRTQGIPGLELPWPIDILVVAAVLGVAQNVLATVAGRREPSLAVPVWYQLAGLAVLPLAYGVGNLAAPFFEGVAQQIVAGFGLAGTATGLAMLGTGTAYDVLAGSTGLPIASDRIALVGLWSLAFAGPWIGQTAAILGPGPDALETVAITFAVWWIVPALALLANVALSIRDDPARALASPPARAVVAGVGFLALSAAQLAAGSLRTIQSVAGATTWDLGWQISLAGGLGLVIAGFLLHHLPRAMGRALASARLAARGIWLAVAGLGVSVLGASVGGVVQGEVQVAGVRVGRPLAAGDAWSVIALATRPLRILLVAGGALVLVAVVVLVATLLRTLTAGAEVPAEEMPPSPALVVEGAR
jgi:cytochrome c oxidase cbb3-type subunit 1